MWEGVSSVDSYDESMRAAFMEDKTITLLFAILAVPQITVPLEHPIVGDCGEKQGTPMITQKDDLWSFGTRDAALQILGNMVYNNREAQNLVRVRGGIELVLNHTKMHPKHPLQREWALFTVSGGAGGEK